MKAKHYRVGNFIKFGELRHRVTHHDIRNLYESELINKVPSSSYSDIPLTEDWLLKIGFEKINHIHGYSFYSLSKSKKNKCHIDIYDTKTKCMGYSVNHCEYVHQLQNLFFAITGTELSDEIAE